MHDRSVDKAHSCLGENRNKVTKEHELLSTHRVTNNEVSSPTEAGDWAGNHNIIESMAKRVRVP